MLRLDEQAGFILFTGIKLVMDQQNSLLDDANCCTMDGDITTLGVFLSSS